MTGPEMERLIRMPDDERRAFDRMVKGLDEPAGPFLVVDANGEDLLLYFDPYASPFLPAPGRWARLIARFRGQN
jgi:hypothetical protein